MKKILIVIITIVSVFTFVSCSNEDVTNSNEEELLQIQSLQETEKQLVSNIGILELENESLISQIEAFETKNDELFVKNEALETELSDFQNSKIDDKEDKYEKLILKNSKLELKDTKYKYLDIKNCFVEAMIFNQKYNMNYMFGENNKTEDGIEDSLLLENSWRLVIQNGEILTRDGFKALLLTKFSDTVTDIYMNDIKEYNGENYTNDGNKLYYNDYLIIQTSDAGFDGFNIELFAELYINSVAADGDDGFIIEAELPIEIIGFDGGKKSTKYKYESESFRVIIKNNEIVFDSNPFEM